MNVLDVELLSASVGKTKQKKYNTACMKENKMIKLDRFCVHVVRSDYWLRITQTACAVCLKMARTCILLLFIKLSPGKRKYWGDDFWNVFFIPA